MPSKQTTTFNNIEKELKKINSTKRKFILGLAQGAGSALGATLVAGLVILVLNRFIKTVDDIPIINKLFTPNVQRLIQDSSPIQP